MYLASPNTQQQAQAVAGMPVLLCFACCPEWIHKGYQQSFSRVLIDSGAFGELNPNGKRVDIGEYGEWSEQWRGHADGIAGLDDIRGDWKRSLRNYEAIPWSFPTWHDTDPPELLPELCAMAKERGGWIGFGLLPPRDGKERVLRDALSRVPESLHVHLWAGRLYTHIRRINSVDSTNWWRDAMALRKDLPWLHYGECLDIIVKRYQRWNRSIKDEVSQGILFEGTA